MSENCLPDNVFCFVFQGILVAGIHEGESFSFSMCNPPFFQTLQEAGQNPHTAHAGQTVLTASLLCLLTHLLSQPVIPLSIHALANCILFAKTNLTIQNMRQHKSRISILVTLNDAQSQGKCVSAGTPEEMVCPGGELGFVSQMVKDSIQLQRRVHWYTSMVGKKATLKQLRSMLHESKVTALRTTEFVQVRWEETQGCIQSLICSVSPFLVHSFICPIVRPSIHPSIHLSIHPSSNYFSN